MSTERVSFKRNYILRIYRTSTPKNGEEFFIQNLGAPDGETANGLVIENMRIEFDITRDHSKHPNSASITIYNLSERNRNAMTKYPVKVELLAGYDGVNELMYSGDVRYAMSSLDGADWVTKLELGDGARATKHARVSRSYRKGTSIKDALKDVARRMGQKLPDNILADAELDTAFNNNVVLYGKAGDELSRLLAPFRYTWSIQDGVLQILTPDDYRPDVFLVSATTGMIGSPEVGDAPKSGKPPKLSVKSLLRPGVYPGAVIQIVSRDIKGLYRIEQVKHSGDSHGSDWMTSMDVKPLPAPKAKAAKTAGTKKLRLRGGGFTGAFDQLLDYIR